MSKGSLLCALVLLQACVVVLGLPLVASSSRRWLAGGQIGDVLLLCQEQDPIRGSCLMLSRGSDEFDGANSDSISDDDLAGDGTLVGDEYASDDGGTSVPHAEADAEEDDDLSPMEDDDGGARDSSGEFGSGGDVECPECGKFFKNDKSMFGHLRSHPNRGYKGATPPLKKLPLSPDTDAGSPASPSPDVDGPSGQHSGRDPELTPFEVLCACVMFTLRCRDSQAVQQVAPPPPPSFIDRKIDVVEQAEGGTGVLVTSNGAAAEARSHDASPDVGNALLCDDHGGSIVKIPKKRRRSISKEDREANRKVKLLVTAPKEKRPYVCKHCKAEFPTHQALGGHMAGHHRDKKVQALNDKGTSQQQAHQATAGQSQSVKQAKASDESWREGLSLSSRRMQAEQLSMASTMGWLSGQAPGGHMRQHFGGRRNDGSPPVVTQPVAADGGRRRPLNIDLNVEAPEQD